MPTRVVAIDDHSLILDAIEMMLRDVHDIELVAVGMAGQDVVQLVDRFRPDVLVLDQRMPQDRDPDSLQRFRPLPTIRHLIRMHGDMRILVLSAWSDPVMVRQVLDSGAKGYVDKSDPEFDIVEAIRCVAQDQMYLSSNVASAYGRLSNVSLTKRQVQVLRSIGHNPKLSYAVLAADLGMSESTFKKHLTLALKRLGVPNNKLAAIKICEQLGLF